MVTKKDLEKELNEKLDTDLEWSRMKRDDLDLLVELVDGGHLIEPMVKLQAKKHGKEALDEQIDEWRPGKIVGRLL